MNQSIMTRSAIPFDIYPTLGIMEGGLREPGIQNLKSLGYSRPYSASDTLYKDYPATKYPTRSYSLIMEDLRSALGPPEHIGLPWSRLSGGFSCVLEPNSFYVPDDPEERAKFYRGWFLSITNLVGILFPFFSYSWESIIGSITFYPEPLFFDIDNRELRERTRLTHVQFNRGPDDTHNYFIYGGELFGHPAFILSGLSIIQSILTRAYRENRGFDKPPIEVFEGGYENVLNQYHYYYTPEQSIYELMTDTAFGGYTERKIPGPSTRYYLCPKETLIDILREYTRDTGTMKDRCARLVWDYFVNRNLDSRPENNGLALYNLDRRDFTWPNGPEVR